ncbi:MarR family transcriptional regulator [Leucobacter allii]|uniref:MarR family transcriptional regulator n=1 Tax=Leucobacter allii TaxID=2932247 RepID=A0ABY4FH68_9MICO|nr:MarR family transcriptional regulator [Leucobacter allii]UOQ56019.1 MarR family transcriptional regulator [Leucobacter allii]UOR00537.1 MarR family transcriptional regulator [Leucobacter allii]
MNATGAGAQDRGGERRLDPSEMAAWTPLIRVAQLLPQALDRTLRERTGLNHARYAILVMLARPAAEQPSMTELARIAGLSRSRLSHAIDALEARGWVERSSCGADRRARSARLTAAGRDALRAAAPAHVAQIRELVLGPLDATEREQLAALLGKLLPGIEASL